MKKPISVKLDEKYWVFIKDKPNKSAFIQGLIKQEMQTEYMKPIVQAVRDELLSSELFFEEMRARLANGKTISIPVPSQNENTPFVPRPPDPSTGYPCCQQPRPCKHWVWNGEEQTYINSLTGKMREAI